MAEVLFGSTSQKGLGFCFGEGAQFLGVLIEGGEKEGFGKREGNVVWGCCDFLNEEEDGQSQSRFSRREGTFQKDNVHRGRGPGFQGIGEGRSKLRHH